MSPLIVFKFYIVKSIFFKKHYAECNG